MKSAEFPCLLCLTSIDICDKVWTWKRCMLFHNLLSYLGSQSRRSNDGTRQVSLKPIALPPINGTIPMHSTLNTSSKRQKPAMPPCTKRDDMNRSHVIRLNATPEQEVY